jgi:hypothetical protein
MKRLDFSQLFVELFQRLTRGDRLDFLGARAICVLVDVE